MIIRKEDFKGKKDTKIKIRIRNEITNYIFLYIVILCFSEH